MIGVLIKRGNLDRETNAWREDDVKWNRENSV